MMRIVFLLFAEERGLLPLDDDLYATSYAASTLRAQLVEDAESDGDEPLRLRGAAFAYDGPDVFADATLEIERGDKLAIVGEWVLVIQGVIFVACVLLFRRGIIGELAAFLRVKL